MQRARFAPDIQITESCSSACIKMVIMVMSCTAHRADGATQTKKPKLSLPSNQSSPAWNGSEITFTFCHVHCGSLAVNRFHQRRNCRCLQICSIEFNAQISPTNVTGGASRLEDGHDAPLIRIRHVDRYIIWYIFMYGLPVCPQEYPVYRRRTKELLEALEEAFYIRVPIMPARLGWCCWLNGIYICDTASAHLHAVYQRMCTIVALARRLRKSQDVLRASLECIYHEDVPGQPSRSILRTSYISVMSGNAAILRISHRRDGSECHSWDITETSQLDDVPTMKILRWCAWWRYSKDVISVWFHALWHSEASLGCEHFDDEGITFCFQDIRGVWHPQDVFFGEELS